MIFFSNQGGRGLGLGLCLTGLCIPVAAASTQLGPEIHEPARQEVVLHLGGALDVPTASVAAKLSHAELTQRIRDYLDLSRVTGSPRPLGLAQGLMAGVPEQDWTPELTLLAATILQRLHRFEEADQHLTRLLELQPDNAQAWLTRYSIAMVRGDLSTATQSCKALGETVPGLIAKACSEELASIGWQDSQAYSRLKQHLDADAYAPPVERDYALVTLADMAARMELPDAGEHWQKSLLMDPHDQYRRVRYADWLLAQEQPEAVLALTQGYEDSDALAVMRAIALTRLEDPLRQDLIARLEQRFNEARWRGEFLHAWEYGRFLLDVKLDASKALQVAQSNWETQRAYPDSVLLARASAAAAEQGQRMTSQASEAGK